MKIKRLHPPFVVTFDSATTMLKLLGSLLHGCKFPLIGMMPAWSGFLLRPLGSLINRLSPQKREWLYGRAGLLEPFLPEEINKVNS